MHPLKHWPIADSVNGILQQNPEYPAVKTTASIIYIRYVYVQSQIRPLPGTAKSKPIPQ